MKAIRVHEFGPPEVMHLEVTSDPTPSSKQVVVQVRAAGVNPVDTYIRAGMYSRKLLLPYTPGSDAAGVIIDVGSDVTRVENGDYVYTSGTTSGAYAGQALCEESQVHRLPKTLTFQQGAAIYVPYATAYRSLFHRAHAVAGETVLVHGATGGVGIAAVQLAHAAGMNVIGTGSTERGRHLILQQSANQVLDHNSPDYLDKLNAMTDGHGVDVVLEMLANVNLGKDLPILSPGGRVVVIGSRGRVEVDPRDTMTKDAAVLGMLLFNTPERDMRSIFSGLEAGFDSGVLRPVVGREFQLAEAPQAHKAIMEQGAYGKIVLIPNHTAEVNPSKSF